jgi:hypothetical protein
MLRFSLIAAVVLALSACSDVKKQMGLTKQSPDEFKVVARAPLTLPPDFSLRPPEPGIPRPQEGTTSQQAKNAVFRLKQPEAGTLEPNIESDDRSLGEMSLLKAAGAGQSDPNIRRILDAETLRINAESDYFLEALVFWQDPQAPGEIVDATEEAKRLRENTALGKPVTAGETPTIERKRKALFEGLF